MLSITDLKDFIDLDIETVHIVIGATKLPAVEATALARQLLATENGISLLHHMYRDQISDSAAQFQMSRAHELRQEFAYFSRKYPLP